MFKLSSEGDPLALDRNRSNTHLHMLTASKRENSTYLVSFGITRMMWKLTTAVYSDYPFGMPRSE